VTTEGAPGWAPAEEGLLGEQNIETSSHYVAQGDPGHLTNLATLMTITTWPAQGERE